MQINLNAPRADDKAGLTEADLDAHLLRMTYRHGECQRTEAQVKGCNQNCMQGRACDCVPDVEDDTPHNRFDAVNGGIWRAVSAALLIWFAAAVVLLLNNN